MHELSLLNSFDGITVNLELTSLCNFKCPYCYERKKAKYTRFFNKHQIFLINRALAQSFHDVHLVLLGGEPYTYPHLEHAFNLFSQNKKIKKITIYSNGSYPERLLDADHIFSWHSTQDNEHFLESIRNCIARRAKVRVKLLIDSPKKLCDIEQKLLSMGVEVLPTFIYRPSAEFDPNTKRIPLGKKILLCEDVTEFAIDGMPVTRRFVIENIQTIGCLCQQSRFCVNNIGNICLGCGAAIDNIFKNIDFFKEYRIQTIKCRCQVCAKDMFLEQRKFLQALPENLLK